MLGKLGRKICCNFDKNAKCILLVKGHKRCVFDETTEQQKELGEQQIGFCALLPKPQRDYILAEIKKQATSNHRSWKD
jgi:hypothetical protein